MLNESTVCVCAYHTGRSRAYNFSLYLNKTVIWDQNWYSVESFWTIDLAHWLRGAKKRCNVVNERTVCVCAYHTGRSRAYNFSLYLYKTVILDPNWYSVESFWKIDLTHWHRFYKRRKKRCTMLNESTVCVCAYHTGRSRGLYFFIISQ